jgi:hypothetical protein
MSRSAIAGGFCATGSWAFMLFLGLSCPGMALAQDSAPEPEVAAPSEPEKPSEPYRDSVGLSLGLASVATDQPTEVNKDGPALVIRASRSWIFPSSLTTSAALGLLNTTIKGSGSYTNGDQEARLTTPFLEGAVGYDPWTWLGFQAGVQLWFAKGSNFAPEADEKGNQPLMVLRARSSVDSLQPFIITLEHIRSGRVEDRTASASLIGFDFPI